MQYLINVDWFQIFAEKDADLIYSPKCFYAGKTKNDKGYINQYELVDGTEFHPLYQHSYAIKLRKFTLAHLFIEPRMSVLAPMSCSLKMSNRVLYASNWCWYLFDILQALHLTFKNITRVDVCADFTTFAKNLHPTEFIQRFLATKGTKKRPQYVRCGSNKYVTIGEKVQTEDGFTLQTEYLRFGTRNSGTCTYLYNKSKELRDKKSKPYIQQAWIDAGLIKDEEDQPDVYRLEFSITQKGTRIEDTSSDEERNEEMMRRRIYCELVNLPFCRSLALDDFSSAKYVEQIFWTYCNKFFKFRAPNKNKTKSTWPEVKLWDIQTTTPYKPRKLCRDLDCGVAERNATKVLQRVLYHFSDMPTGAEKALEKSVEFLTEIYNIKTMRSKFDFNTLFLERCASPLAFENFDAFVESGFLKPKQMAWLTKYIDEQVSARTEDFVRMNTDPVFLYSDLMDKIFPELKKERDQYIRDNDIWGTNESYYDGLPIFYDY